MQDLVERHLIADSPDDSWVADIVDVLSWAGFLFVAVVVDAWRRGVVG